MATLSTADLIEQVATQTNIPKAQVKRIVDLTFAAMSEALSRGDRLQLATFGSFDIRDRQARQTVNPQTHERMTVPATKAVGFRAAGKLKERVVGTSAEATMTQAAGHPPPQQRSRGRIPRPRQPT